MRFSFAANVKRNVKNVKKDVNISFFRLKNAKTYLQIKWNGIK